MLFRSAEAIATAAGISIDPLADSETVVQGGSLAVTVRTFAPQGAPITVTAEQVTAPSGWNVESMASADNAPAPNAFAARDVPSHTARYRLAVPADAPLTQPYFLQQKRQGDSYAWADDAPKTLPFGPAPLEGHVTMEVGGVSITITRPVQYRFGDRVRGELRREVNVVPAVVDRLGLVVAEQGLVVAMGGDEAGFFHGIGK